MKITRKSMFSGGINTLDIDVTEGQLLAWHKSPGGSSSIWSSDRASVEKWLEDSIRGTREFWEEKIRWSIDGYPRDASTMVLRINGQHYVAKPGIKKTNRLNRDCLGFAGRVFRWEMLNAPGYIYECNDVWSQGKIPPEFADRLPDNARWA